MGMLLLGLGLGMTMPTATLAVQNSVEFRDMGVATSMVTFFRSLGGCIGLAIYGAIFNAKIMSSGVDETLLQAPDSIKLLPVAVRTDVIDVLSDAVATLFVVAVPIVFLGWILTLFLKEIPLRETTALSDAQSPEQAGGAAGGRGRQPRPTPHSTSPRPAPSSTEPLGRRFGTESATCLAQRSGVSGRACAVGDSRTAATNRYRIGAVPS